MLYLVFGVRPASAGVQFWVGVLVFEMAATGPETSNVSGLIPLSSSGMDAGVFVVIANGRTVIETMT